MALATRPKPSVHHKKRQAGHHRHSKTYIRPYWPYLPMLAIVGTGVLVNKMWNAATLADPTGSLSAAQPVARIQTLTNDQSSAILAAAIVITAITFAVFVVRHWYRLHRLINKGETFVSHHAWLDIATVFVFTAGFILTRPNGIIG